MSLLIRIFVLADIVVAVALLFMYVDSLKNQWGWILGLVLFVSVAVFRDFKPAKVSANTIEVRTVKEVRTVEVKVPVPVPVIISRTPPRFDDVFNYYSKLFPHLPQELQMSDITPFIAPANHFQSNHIAHAELGRNRICFHENFLPKSEAEAVPLIKHELVHHYLFRHSLPSDNDSPEFKKMCKQVGCE